jgi:hypothetical protein
MFSITLLDSTTTELNVTGQKQKGAGYNNTVGCNHTVSIATINMKGRVFIEGSLSTDPTYIDWFPIQLLPGQDFIQFPLNPNNPTGSSGGDSTVVAYNFSGNYIWIRARLDRNYLIPYPADPQFVGAIKYILLNYGSVSPAAVPAYNGQFNRLSLASSQPGPPGPQGPTGVIGPTGAASTISGPTGSIGETGPQGVQGIQGIQGVQGINGPTGPQGPTGPNSTQIVPIWYAWNSNTNVANTIIPLLLPPWTGNGSVISASYYTHGSGSPSFTFDVMIGATSVNGLNVVNVNSSSPTTTLSTGSNLFVSNSSLSLIIGNVSGTANQAIVQVNLLTTLL